MFAQGEDALLKKQSDLGSVYFSSVIYYILIINLVNKAKQWAGPFHRLALPNINQQGKTCIDEM